MPKFGQAHPLLGGIHKDTQAPAAGADPDDGQVATWSAALAAWIAADAATGGVTDHGLLTGLSDDDHSLYALADKSRPSPWVAAGDLAGRSLADLGTKAHDLLDGLSDDDHSQYPLSAGRGTGQLITGGTGAGHHLTLYATSHATQGYIRSFADLFLVTGKIRSPMARERINLADASPHVTMIGEVRMGDKVGIGTAPWQYTGMKISPTLAGAQDMKLIDASPTMTLTTGSAAAYGLKAQATVSVLSAATLIAGYGLYFTAFAAGAGDVTALYAAWVKAGLMFYSGDPPDLWGLAVKSPLVMTATHPDNVYGIEIEDQGKQASSTWDAIGLKIADQTVTSGLKYLIEAGPVTPYLRLVGGANPAANESNLLLKLGATLKQITEYGADSAGVGYRALRVPN